MIYRSTETWFFVVNLFPSSYAIHLMAVFKLVCDVNLNLSSLTQLLELCQLESLRPRIEHYYPIRN